MARLRRLHLSVRAGTSRVPWPCSWGDNAAGCACCDMRGWSGRELNVGKTVTIGELARIEVREKSLLFPPHCARRAGRGRAMLRAFGLRPAWCLPLVDTVRQWARMSSRNAADAWARVEADAVYFAASKSGRKRALRLRLADQKRGKERPRSEYRRIRREEITRRGLDK